MADPTNIHIDEAALAGAKQRHPSGRHTEAKPVRPSRQLNLAGVDPDAELTDEENLSRVRDLRRSLARARLARGA